jgi:DnaJ-class molecular chaperone
MDCGWQFARVGWSILADTLALSSRFWFGAIFGQPLNSGASRRDRPWFEVLDVRASASREEIRKAYHEQMKKYHPDCVSGLGMEFQHLALVTAMEINQAYEEAKRRF